MGQICHTVTGNFFGGWGVGVVVMVGANQFSSLLVSF